MSGIEAASGELVKDLAGHASGSNSAVMPGYAFLTFFDCPACGLDMDVCNSHGKHTRPENAKYTMCSNSECTNFAKIWKRPKIELIGA